MLTCVRYQPLSWPRLIQCISSKPMYLLSILILSSLYRLGLSSGFLLSGFPTKIVHTYLLSSIRATCTACFILLDLNTPVVFSEEYRLRSSSLYRSLHSRGTLSLLGPNIHLSSLFSVSLCYLLNVKDRVPHSCKTIGKIMVLCVCVWSVFPRIIPQRRVSFLSHLVLAHYTW